MAAEQFEKLIKEYPAYEHIRHAYLYYADLLSYLNMHDKAITICLEAEKKAKDNLEKGDVFHMLATVYQKKQNFIDAEKYFYKSLELFGYDKHFYSKVFYDLGKLYIEKGEKEKAKDAFKKALKFRRFSPWLKYTRDYVVEIKENLKEQRRGSGLHP